MKRILSCALLLVLSFSLMPCSRAEVDREANKKIIFDYITKEIGLTPAVACGILANVKAESNFDPAAIGDGGDAYGICQWNSRRDTMVKYCEDNGYGNWKNIYGQLAYLEYELETYKKSVGAYLKEIPNTAQGAYDAAYHFCYYYEVPANRTTKSKQRGTNAVTTYWRDYYGGSVSTYTITYDTNGGTGTPASQTKTEGIPTLITLTRPTLAGHSLVGWSLNKDASTLDYKEYEEFCINQDTTLYAVWERAIDDGTPPDASVSLDGHTYELYKGAYTWSYANSFAESKGGYLATVKTSGEYNVIKSLTNQAEGGVWLGGKHALGNWQWVTGEAFDDEVADSVWASGEPYALYGPTEEGKLMQRADGKWMDLHSSALSAEGFVVEYGSPANEIFPMYELTVSTSLRLREGPGTTYETLNHVYTGEIITILETVSGASYDWGWGYSTNGKTGWCAMKIPDYMVEIGGIDENTGLIYTPFEEGCAISGYMGSADEVTVPSYIGNLAVVSVLENAFSDAAAPETVYLPSGIQTVSPSSMKDGGIYVVNVATDSHRAASLSGHNYRCVYPSKTLHFPSVLTEIHEDAFTESASIVCVNLSDTSVSLICTGAFSYMENLLYVCLPKGALTIEDGAFTPVDGIIFVVENGSDAHEWAQLNGADMIVTG